MRAPRVARGRTELPNQLKERMISRPPTTIRTARPMTSSRGTVRIQSRGVSFFDLDSLLATSPPTQGVAPGDDADAQQQAADATPLERVRLERAPEPAQQPTRVVQHDLETGHSHAPIRLWIHPPKLAAIPSVRATEINIVMTVERNVRKARICATSS